MSFESHRPQPPSDRPAASGQAQAAVAPALPYEAMFLASPLPASVSGLHDGRLIAVNDAWLAMMGCTRDSVLGRTTVELGLWLCDAQRQAFVDQMDAPDGSQQRYRLRLAGGVNHSVRIHSVKLPAEPQPLLLAFVVQATREAEAQHARQRSEAALLQTNLALQQRLELHAALEKLAHVGFWTHDTNSPHLFWSPGMYEFTGFATDAPPLPAQVQAHIHPDDRPAWLAARQACDFREVQYRWLHADGRVRWFRTRMGRTAVAGNPQADFGVVQDITAERETHDRLGEQLRLLEHITARVPGLVYRIRLWSDGRSEISYVNDRVRDMFEVEPEALRKDARVSFLRVHPDDKRRVQSSLEQAVRSLTVWRQDYRICLSGGRTRWYSVEAVPQAEADGSVVLHGFTTDVTEARLAAQQLQRQHRMLDAVREAQALYIGGDDKRHAFKVLLAAFLRLTTSAYGFVGEVFHQPDGTPCLRTHALTHTGWDEPTRRFHESQMDAGMAFGHLRALFDRAMVTGQPVIANGPRPDDRVGTTPAGPPPDAFLGLPLVVDAQVVALVGLANQPGGYSAQDVEFLQPLLGTVRQLVLAWRSRAERQRTLQALEGTSRELAEKSETLQAALDSISQGLTKVDANGRVLIHNRQMLALLNLSQAFMNAQPTHDEIVRFQRERGDFGTDMELVEPKALPYLSQPGGMVSPEKYWRKTPDGRTLEVRSRQLADGGMVRTFADVTSYIEAQEALQAERQRLAWVLDATRSGIWEIDLQSGALRINERWAEMLGHTLQELQPVDQTTWRSRVHPEDLPRVRQLREQHLNGELPFYNCDLRLRHKDGHWVWINTQGRVHQRDAQGRPIFMSGIHLDISDRVAAQQQMLALNASLEQRVGERTAALERSLRDMEAISYSIAHDLRAPLRSVNGFASLIAEETDPPLSPAVSDMFARINSASRKMGQMLTDMLELLRVVRVDLATAPIDLESLAQAVAGELAQEAAHAEIAIGPLPWVMGDTTLLRQLLYNLMENALKYARHRTPPRLTLRFDEQLGAFCLRDNGMGFDMTHAAKLFGLFQRLHAGTDVPGTGVGLAIVSRIVERHGGRIWAEAQPDVGATFWWTLPRA